MVIRSDLRTKVNSAEDNIRGINYCDEYKYLGVSFRASGHVAGFVSNKIAATS